MLDIEAYAYARAVERTRLPPPEVGELLIGPEYEHRAEYRYTSTRIYEMRRSGPHFRWGHCVLWSATRHTGKSIGGVTTGVSLARECVEAAREELERTRPRRATGGP